MAKASKGLRELSGYEQHFHCDGGKVRPQSWVDWAYPSRMRGQRSNLQAGDLVRSAIERPGSTEMILVFESPVNVLQCMSQHGLQQGTAVKVEFGPFHGQRQLHWGRIRFLKDQMNVQVRQEYELPPESFILAEHIPDARLTNQCQFCRCNPSPAESYTRRARFAALGG